MDVFLCLYTYEFWLSLCKIVRSSVILLLPLFNEDMFDMTSVASLISYVDLFITSQLFTKWLWGACNLLKWDFPNMSTWYGAVECWLLSEALPDFSLVTEVPVDFLSFSVVCFRWKSGFSSWSVINLLKVGTEYVNLSSDSLWFCIDFWFSLWLGKLLFVGMSSDGFQWLNILLIFIHFSTHVYKGLIILFLSWEINMHSRYCVC